MSALDATGYDEEIKVGLDSAASNFYVDGGYSIDGNRLSPDEMVDYYADLVATYPIILLEDPFEEEAYEEFLAEKSAITKPFDRSTELRHVSQTDCSVVFPSDGLEPARVPSMIRTEASFAA